MSGSFRSSLRLGAMCAASMVLWPALAQTPPPKRPPEVLQRLSDDAQKAGLSEPFVGITAKGQVEPGLYKIHSTGVSTAPVRKAAEEFLAALTPQQRAKTLFPVGDDEWRKWMNQSFYVRQGVSFTELNPQQRERALARRASSRRATSCI
jgi:hypothetical protein